MAVLGILYISNPPAAILVNWLGVEDWGYGETIWGVFQYSTHAHVAGRIFDFIFPSRAGQTTGLGSWASRGDQVQP